MSSTALMVYGGGMFLAGACFAWFLDAMDAPEPEPPPAAKYRADEPHDCTASVYQGLRIPARPGTTHCDECEHIGCCRNELAAHKAVRHKLTEQKKNDRE